VGTFAEALTTHQSLVFSLAFHMLHNAALAEEVAQEVFLRLYRDFARIEGPMHLLRWLRRTATHRCLDVLRRSRRHRQVPLDDVELVAPRALAPDPLVARTLRRLVAELPPNARAVVVLRYQEDLDPREISDLLDLPVNTVKSRLQRALGVLRRRLAEFEEPSHVAT
jgi:RNA polymerase sigma-70 factor (ECF subfamily)